MIKNKNRSGVTNYPYLLGRKIKAKIHSNTSFDRHWVAKLIKNSIT